MQYIKTYNELLSYLNNGGDINKYYDDHLNGNILFHLSEVKAIDLALERGIETNIDHEFEWNPLFFTPNLDTFKRLVEIGYDIKSVDSSGQNLLFFQYDDLDIFQYLLDNGVSFTETTEMENSYFFMADDFPKETERYFIKKYGQDFINTFNNDFSVQILNNLREEDINNCYNTVKTKEFMELLIKHFPLEIDTYDQIADNPYLQNTSSESLNTLFSYGHPLPKNIFLGTLNKEKIEFFYRHGYDLNALNKETNIPYFYEKLMDHQNRLSFMSENGLDKILECGFNGNFIIENNKNLLDLCSVESDLDICLKYNIEILNPPESYHPKIQNKVKKYLEIKEELEYLQKHLKQNSSTSEMTVKGKRI